MQIIENHPLKSLNTFGIDVRAKFFTEFNTTTSLVDFVQRELKNFGNSIILNGGSNVLFAGDFDGLVMKISTSGMQVLSEDNAHVEIKVEAGQNWDEFVLYGLDKGYFGLENLSLIPGNVGAAPMQNIGAYGVEQKDFFVSLEALNLSTGKMEKFNKNDCRFGYRESIFKNTHKHKYIITSATYRLNKYPEINIDYGAIKTELAKMGLADNPHPVDVSKAVRHIRNNKLPNPEELGNAGSFFKNPIIEKNKYDQLKAQFPDLVAFAQADGKYKVAAGWLIDHLGWKGKRIGDAGVCKNQALVLVNYGKATGQQILELAAQIQKSIQAEFGIQLQPEVNIIHTSPNI